MFEFIGQYKNRVLALSIVLPAIGRYFHALALAESYITMVRTFMERAVSHPEIIRTPAMLDVLLEHFQTYPLEHIDLSKEHIFNEEFVGTRSHLEAWQEAGYSMDRSDEDYDWRVLIWQHLWNGTPIVTHVTQTSKHGKTWTYDWEFTPKHRTNHTDGSVDETMNARMANYSSVLRYVPYWLPLNDGTGAIGANPGYPAVDGLHFVDIGTQSIPRNNERYLLLLQRCLADIMDAEEVTDILAFTQQWVKAKLPYTDTHDIDMFKIAEKLALV